MVWRLAADLSPLQTVKTPPMVSNCAAYSVPLLKPDNTEGTANVEQTVVRQYFDAVVSTKR